MECICIFKIFIAAERMADKNLHSVMICNIQTINIIPKKQASNPFNEFSKVLLIGLICICIQTFRLDGFVHVFQNVNMQGTPTTSRTEIIRISAVSSGSILLTTNSSSWQKNHEWDIASNLNWTSLLMRFLNIVDILENIFGIIVQAMALSQSRVHIFSSYTHI